MNIKKVLLGLAALITALAGGASANDMLGAGTSRFNNSQRTVISAAATTTGSSVGVKDFQFVNWTLATQSASGTVTFACSMADSAPDFSVVKSVTNTWDVVDVIDLEDGASIDGDTGIVLANSTDVRQLQIRDANFRWCTAVLSPWTAGTTTVLALPANNQ